MNKLGRLLRFIIDKSTKAFKAIFRFFRRLVRAIHSRKRYAIPFYAIVSYALLVFLIIKFSGDPAYDNVIADKRVNDVTAINPIQVGTTFKPESIEEIVEAIELSKGPISIGGGRFSMGGQVAYENSLHFDMRNFNKVLALDTVHKQVTVQP